MNIEKTRVQMRKGVLEYCILKILSYQEAYPSEILEILKNVNLIVVEGTIYPILTRLKNEELLSYRWEESRGGPPRKYFQLTTKGEAFLKELEKSWNELQNAVNQIQNLKK